MPNIGSMLKQEIARLSRRELRGEMQATKKASTQYRHHIAALRRQLGALERQVATLQRRVGSGHRAEATASSEDGAPKLRFAANRLRAQRAKHGLTAGEYAKLLGVSEQTIYNWEHGTHRPGRDRLAVIAELRGLGKRAVQARLEEMPGKAASTKPAATKKRAAKSASKQRATKKPAGPVCAGARRGGCRGGGARRLDAHVLALILIPRGSSVGNSTTHYALPPTNSVRDADQRGHPKMPPHFFGPA